MGEGTLRDKGQPRGFAGPSPNGQAVVDTANGLMDFSEALLIAAGRGGAIRLMEFPEDLGITPNGWPASPWQKDGFRNIENTISGAIHQSDHGGETPKPTRLLLEGPEAPSWLYEGWPQFDSKGLYTGPLPRPAAGVPNVRSLPGDIFQELEQHGGVPAADV